LILGLEITNFKDVEGEQKMAGTWTTGLLAIFMLISIVKADLIFTYEGVEERVPLTQLWYEGRWKELEAFTAPITHDQEGDLRGKVVVVETAPPQEPVLRRLQKKQPLAVLCVRPGNFPPGFAMQLVDGSNRSDIYVPAMEAVYPKGPNLKKLPDGTVVRFEPTPNLHKRAAESKFQLIMNLVLSFWELAIMLIGSYRIYEFYALAQFPWLAIAPICCAFEVVGASIRFAYTIVDPFFTYRMISEPVSNVLITVSFPFSETAGILLTFFWAESLAKVQIRAMPFISAYKWPAAAAVATLFIIEIICDVLRVTLKRLGFSPIIISIILYVIVAVTLIACYVSCAIAIGRRISGSMGKRRAKVWAMSLRIVISSSGYLIMVISIIIFAIVQQRVYGRGASLSAVFIGINLAGLMQVLALRPIKMDRSHSHSSKTGSGKTGSHQSSTT
jgi:hypothetical protein